MKQGKKISELIDPESVTVFGLPLKITPKIRDITDRLSQSHPEKYKAIKRSIELANGKLDEPIKIMKLGSEQGDYYTIVDGHTRFEILMELNIMPPDADFVVLKDVMCVDDAKALAHRINGLRRQQEIYQQAVSAIRAANPVSTDRELADLSGVGHTTINRVRFILGSIEPEIKTEAEKEEYAKIIGNLESGTTKIDAEFKQLNMAIEVSTAIYLIEDLKFKADMQTKYERLKFTNKNVLKKLQEDIDAHNAESEGLDLTVDPYSKDIRPLMDKAIKLQGVYDGITTVSSAGKPEALENVKNSLRKFLMNDINENIVDVLEGARAVIIDELETKQTKDISVIMKEVDKLLTVSNTGYFVSLMKLPNPKIEPAEKKPKQKSVA